MRTAVLAMALLLLSQVIPGNPERCWKSQGACREECTKNEKFYILCWSGKMCCVKPQKVPQLFQDLD